MDVLVAAVVVVTHIQKVDKAHPFLQCNSIFGANHRFARISETPLYWFSYVSPQCAVGRYTMEITRWHGSVILVPVHRWLAAHVVSVFNGMGLLGLFSVINTSSSSPTRIEVFDAVDLVLRAGCHHYICWGKWMSAKSFPHRSVERRHLNAIPLEHPGGFLLHLTWRGLPLGAS